MIGVSLFLVRFIFILHSSFLILHSVSSPFSIFYADADKLLKLFVFLRILIIKSRIMEAGKFNMWRLHNEEWFELQTEFSGEVAHFTPERLGLTPLFKKYAALYEKADKALATLRKSVYTKRLENADKKRDRLLRGFYGLVRASLHQPIAEKLEAAERVDNLLKGYQKNVLDGNYIEQSGSIYNLLQDLKGNYKDAVSLLGFTDWVTAIDQAEKEFLGIEATREEESVEKPKEDMKTIRKQTDAYYHAMINALETQLLLDGLGGSVVVDPEDLDDQPHFDGDDTPPEFYGNVVYNFVIAWNVALQKYINLLAQRAGRRAKKEESDDVADE
jgi:hypothetical protein